jgi:AcrR family transcriptional regulator
MAIDVTAGATTLLPPGLDLTPAKRRLYETAIELFGRNTYHAVSIRDIATALGQQPSTIYFHVSSKQDLLYEIAIIGHRAAFAALRDALMDAGADPHDQLRCVVQAHVRQHVDYPALARVVNRELHALDEVQRETVLGIRDQVEQIFRDVLERGARLGAFENVDSFLDTKAIGAMAVRLPEWWTPDSVYSREQIIDKYSQYALNLVS